VARAAAGRASDQRSCRRVEAPVRKCECMMGPGHFHAGTPMNMNPELDRLPPNSDGSEHGRDVLPELLRRAKFEIHSGDGLRSRGSRLVPHHAHTAFLCRQGCARWPQVRHRHFANRGDLLVVRVSRWHDYLHIPALERSQLAGGDPERPDFGNQRNTSKRVARLCWTLTH
jgi:hypothetical protein